MEYTIEVTQADIGRGVKGNGSLCPIALAAKRAITLFDWSNHALAVDESSLSVLDEHGGVVATAHLPWAVAWYILDFDRGRAVAPLAFPIRLDPAWPPPRCFRETSMLSRSFVRIGDGPDARYINTARITSVRREQGDGGFAALWRVRFGVLDEGRIPESIDLSDDEVRPLLEALDRLTIL